MRSLYISELMPEEELKNLIESHGCGLELITFSISENLDHFPDTLERVREMLKRLGDPPVSVHGPFLDLNPMTFDSKIRQATMDRFNEAYESACILNAGKIIFHSGMIPAVYFLEGWAERTADFFSEFMEGKTGIEVCMENVLDREFQPLEETVRLVGHPDFGLCLDIGHAHCYSPHSVLEWACALAPFVRHIHVHDNDGIWDHHLGLGAGTIPLKELFEVLDEKCPDPSLTIECSSTEAAEQSFRFLEMCDHKVKR